MAVRNLAEVLSPFERRTPTSREHRLIEALRGVSNGLTILQLRALDIYSDKSLEVLLKRWVKMRVIETEYRTCDCGRQMRVFRLRPSAVSDGVLPAWK